MNCDICGKSFTGLVCFQQHEASEKHKNKVKLFQMRASNSIPQSPSTSTGNGISQTEATYSAGNGIHQTQATSASSIETQIIRCDTCEIDFAGLSNFQKHVNSLQHVEMFKRKNDNSIAGNQLNCIPVESEFTKKEANPGYGMPINFPSLMTDSFAHCEACNKRFSGPEPYQQHLASENHKKKCIRKELFSTKLNFDTVDSDKIVPFIKQEGNASANGSSVTTKPYAECSFCDMQFSGPEPYQLHVDSERHQRKVAAKGNASANSSSGTTKPYAECSFCDMQFTGPEPYQLHIDSEGHLRRIAGNQNSIMQSLKSNDALRYRCNICDKDFSGPIPHNDHMISKVHKKKVQNIELLKNFRNPTALQSDCTDYSMPHINSNLAADNPAFYCEVCKKQSTGPIPHEAHLASDGHLKNIRAVEMERNLKLKRESLMQHHLENAIELKKENLNELSREGEMSSTSNNYNDKANEVNKDFYISKDLILCDALKNIGVMAEDDLNVTIFYPNDEIVFV